MKATRQLSNIIEKYCIDYKQLIDENTFEIEARYNSYKSLLKIYTPDNIFSLVNEMIAEVDMLPLHNIENTRLKIFNMFTAINNHKYYSQIEGLPNGDISETDELLSLTFIQVDEMLVDVGASINKILNEFCPTRNKTKLSKPQTPETFNDIFEERYSKPDDIKKFITILIKIGLVDENNKWLKHPTASRLFYKALYNNGIIKKTVRYNAAGEIFSKYFSGLTKYNIINSDDKLPEDVKYLYDNDGNDGKGANFNINNHVKSTKDRI